MYQDPDPVPVAPLPPRVPTSVPPQVQPDNPPKPRPAVLVPGPSAALPPPVPAPVVMAPVADMPVGECVRYTQRDPYLYVNIGPMPTEEQALQALRCVLKDNNAQWRNEGQKEAVMAAVAWEKDLVVILPTGSGKSAVVATAAMLETNKITAVFLPLRSLLADWQRRLERLEYPFEVFNPSKPRLSGQNSLVLVSLDAAGGAAWRQAVTSLRSDIRLNRIVFDEAHLVLTEGSYRGIMHQVKELRFCFVQVMLLSATIPPVSLPHLGASFTLAAGDNTRIIRTTSNRPELSFKAPVVLQTPNTQVSTSQPLATTTTDLLHTDYGGYSHADPDHPPGVVKKPCTPSPCLCADHSQWTATRDPSGLRMLSGQQ